MIYVPYEIWIAVVILITYGLFPIVCGWPSLHCLILKVSVFFSSGGVVLASRDGKIVFESTLDARLEVVFRKKLLRYLWPSHFLIYRVTTKLLSWVHVQWSFFLEKKANEFTTLCFIHHWDCLIFLSILSKGISVLLLLRTHGFSFSIIC